MTASTQYYGSYGFPRYPDSLWRALAENIRPVMAAHHRKMLKLWEEQAASFAALSQMYPAQAGGRTISWPVDLVFGEGRAARYEDGPAHEGQVWSTTMQAWVDVR